MIKQNKYLEGIIKELYDAFPNRISIHGNYTEKQIARMQGQQDVIRSLENKLPDKEDTNPEN